MPTIYVQIRFLFTNSFSRIIFLNSLSPIFFYKFNITNSFSQINLQIWKSSKKFVRIRKTSFWFIFVKSVLRCEWPVLYFYAQCAIYVQDMRKIVLISPMCNICARLYFFPQCAMYVQDLRKIVLISPMRNICARLAQDCTSLPNVQRLQALLEEICHISALNLEWYSLHSYFWIATGFDFFLNKHL